MIEVKRLSKRYGEKEILKDINLTIEKGEIFTIIGPTGSGKTTLLRLIDLLDMPTSGEIFFNGANASSKRRREIRRKMSMLFQKPALFKTSVYDNVTYGLKFRGIGRYSIDKKVKHALDTVGLLDYAKRIAPTLSGGEAQRVALARAIVTEPEVLLLDEPTANLDPIATEKIEELIAHINREYKTTIIISTHDRLQGQRLADRIAVMMKGEISQVGQPHEIFYSPKNGEIARFVGVENIVPSVVESNEGGVTVVDIGGFKVTCVSPFPAGEAVLFCLRAESIILSKELGKSSLRNVLPSTILKITPVGPLVRVKLENTLVALITKQAAEELKLAVDDQVYASFKATSVHVVKNQ
ncbi:MAG: ABC transporter ATP-binding protein [Methanocellales archaeon]|nr:ABC transporter ATP-binding protein [Methanocellales archaeon]MDD3291688.1 ABC transporter ATP-binding protein [Methanocellales archaeon]MDD5235038.1 ABC transporter ATP-binding protein [Methanocellales archaeon]MDD5485176.1 ABC transporter ATP-binding protein [Methanocellales archaeon]